MCMTGSLCCTAAIGTTLLFFYFFFFFRAAGEAYGSSQARVKLGLELLAYTTATATPDLSHIFDLYHSSRQRWIFNPLGRARD